MTGKAVRIEDDWGDCPEGNMDYIVDMLGTGFRDKMISTMGGMEIKVPVGKKVLTDCHVLVQRMGRIDADELVEVMGGAVIYIPTGNYNPSGKRDSVIALVKAGKTNNEIARALGISERMVRRHRSRSGLNGHKLAARLGVGCHQLHTIIAGASSCLLAPQ